MTQWTLNALCVKQLMK